MIYKNSKGHRYKGGKFNMNVNKLASRIVILRTESGLTQKDFAIKISEFANKKTYFSPLTIASWEQGQKTPSCEMLVCLALYFGVTVDYLVGLNDSRDGETIVLKKVDDEDPVCKKVMETKIPTHELPLYDGQPVYVVFNQKQYRDQWGILDYDTQTVFLAGHRVTMSPTCDYYSYVVPSYLMQRPERRALTYSNMMSAKKIWIELTTMNSDIKAQYDGWYHHNENKTALINAIGLTLPYDGLEISFKAYSCN